ncbi:mechanosensitive ion channel family protein [Leucobacter weissii]|uniref:Mechanosensitive ion channel family protein n=1 Tax=Leucobacter weissii TaxID=1983706 RepID=A0A939MLT3_9MICO|nr:mechanosensitive ion channel family protein [Leucobacter weissii]MBO1902911.1 mechanosensitive ion channel family protein [Leucobacter weissii]
MAEFWAAVADFFEQYQVLFRILLIIAAALFANWLLRLILHRAVHGVVRGVKRANQVDATQELLAAPQLKARAVQRTRTLGTVGRHVISWTIAVIAVILILSQLGVNLAALLTSAGIVAAGLAFGAQNIVKDILNGIFMVFEDQLGVGDMVTIDQITGTVEDVGIRVTKVRAFDGTLWFIRNGEILTLGNVSQGWGRAIIDITVDAEADLDAVERVALESARDLIESPEFARRVTGGPEMLGLESVFGDRATLRLTLRTRPEAQFAVQRELRAKIKKRFGQLGIQLAAEIPKPSGGAA